MKKLSLVLALILVFTCCAFVACSDETDTSSADSSAASSAATSSNATSSAASSEASSEDASSEDASSEDASSEDESSEASGEVSEGEPVTDVTGTNVAKGKTYTGADHCTSVDNAYNAKLTDGVAATEGGYDSNWFGYWYNPGSAAPSNMPGGVGTCVIDLAKVETITAIRVNLWNCNASGIGAAKSIVASVSEDGNSWTEIGALALPATNDPAWASIKFDNVSGQYVKLVITAGDGAIWTFLNEIEVYN